MRKRTRELIDLDRMYVWHPFTQMREWLEGTPLVIERGEGNYLIDTEGRRYLDGVSSLWVTVHGHRKGAIDRAVAGQLKRIAHSTLLGLGNVPSILLAEKLVEITPPGLAKVFFSDNGSTAVEVALKMSFQYWQEAGKPEKKKFVAFTGAYHGDTVGGMSVGEIDIFIKKYRPLLFEVLRAPYPYCYRCPVGEKLSPPDCKSACLAALEDVLEKNRGEVASIIIEPLVEGAAGIVTSPPGFLKGVGKLARKYGVHLIADEVAVGFGRTGTMFACDAEGVRPDFLCLGKGITGGYLPLAATLTTDKVYRAFLGRYGEYKSFFHGHTYSGNPLGCSAALANIEVFEKEKVLEKLKPKTRLFGKLLEKFKDLQHVGDVRWRGLMAGVELVADKAAKRPYQPGERVGHRVSTEARERGLIIRPIGDTVVVMPPLSITEAETRRILSITYESIRKITG